MMNRIRSNREKGALALYVGKSEQEAMQEAGLVYSPANGRRFRNSPDVRERLKSLFEADRPLFVLEALRARREREAIAYARMGSYFEDALDDQGMPAIDDKGEPVVRFKGFSKLTDQQIAAIASFKTTKAGYEIKLHDKAASLRVIEERVDPLPARQGSGDEDVPEPADNFDPGSEFDRSVRVN